MTIQIDYFGTPSVVKCRTPGMNNPHWTGESGPNHQAPIPDPWPTAQTPWPPSQSAWPGPSVAPFSAPPVLGSPAAPKPSRNTSERIGVVISVLISLAFIGLKINRVTNQSTTRYGYPNVPSFSPVVNMPVQALSRVAIELAPDGCGVVRPDIQPAPHGLGWSVKDAGGFEVLQRNALGETRYRYFQSGTFTIELVAWDGEKYAPMSNQLTIRC